MKWTHWLLMVCCFLFAGCSSFKSIKPVSPEIGNPLFPKTIDSLHPVFRWEALQEPNVAYDFILYEGFGGSNNGFGASTGIRGEKVYYQEGLTEPHCELDQPLKTKTEYYWSVRVRRGEVFSDWALYDYTYFTGVGIGQIRKRHFVFRTPG